MVALLLWEILVCESKRPERAFAYKLPVSYADFVLVSFLQFIRRFHEEAFTKALAVDDAIKKVYEACGKWLERDSY